MSEPIFSRQEQGVVYLFSRYWDKIDTFKGKRIFNIHTHFPDFSVEDIETGAIEAIEFEYGLNAFRSHLNGDLKKLKEDGIKRLYIVYWDEDADRKDLLQRIRRHFAGKVVFLCLSEYFSPSIEPDSAHLRSSWIFSPKKRLCEKYSFTRIKDRTKTLMEVGDFERLATDRGLYRLIGFNKSGSDFIECDHWRTIHLFTTSTPFGRDGIPCKLFVKPTGCQYFWGYFDIRFAFVIKKGGESVRDYFKHYYFYPYCECYKDHTCFVYTQFNRLEYKQGVDLYKDLKRKKYALQQSSELIRDAEHIRQIGRIVGKGR